MDVKSRNGEKFEIFSKFLAHPVETPWPTLTVIYQNVRRSLPYMRPNMTMLRKTETVGFFEKPMYDFL